MHGQETSLLIAVILSSVIVFLIMVYFIITIIRHQRLNSKLYKEKLHIEITTLENERKRIAADLHDELGPVLSSVRLQLSCINSENPETDGIINDSKQHIDSILNKIREIANDLMPGVLLRKGLVPAVKEFSDAVNINAGGLKVQYYADPFELNDKDKEVHIYRMIKEIIHNVIKHAQAQNIDIKMEKKNNRLFITAADNGKGFDAPVVLGNGTGMGLSNLVSRVEMLKGNIHVDSRAGKGTRINIEIPD